MPFYVALRADDSRIQDLTMEEARDWATQAARQHPGIEVMVFEAIATVTTDTPIPVTVTVL